MENNKEQRKINLTQAIWFRIENPNKKNYTDGL